MMIKYDKKKNERKNVTKPVLKTFILRITANGKLVPQSTITMQFPCIYV